MTSIPLGFAYTPWQPPESLPALAAAADEHLDELWLWEDCFCQSGMASAAIALAGSSRLTVGLGLLPVPLRNVALTAMELATLHRTYPGRFKPGVGHGVQEWMGQVGVRAASPMTLLTEYATALRRLLAGEEVTVAGRYVKLDGVRLDWPPAPGAPLFLGGTGPKSLELSARLGDGVLLASGLSDADVAGVRELVGPAWAEQHDGPPQILHQLLAATGDGSRERVLADLPNWGVAPEESRGAFGSAEQIAARIRDCVRAGATTVVIQPTKDEPDPAGLVRFLGEQVKPLLAE